MAFSWPSAAEVYSKHVWPHAAAPAVYSGWTFHKYNGADLAAFIYGFREAPGGKKKGSDTVRFFIMQPHHLPFYNRDIYIAMF